MGLPEQMDLQAERRYLQGCAERKETPGGVFSLVMPEGAKRSGEPYEGGFDDDDRAAMPGKGLFFPADRCEGVFARFPAAGSHDRRPADAHLRRLQR